MNLSIHTTFLPHLDPEASLAFYRDILGFEVRNDVGYEGMRWITLGSATQPDVSLVIEPPAADPGITDDERRQITEMVAKGTFARILLATPDVEVVQEPMDMPYGVRDCAVRDPAGNLLRIQQHPAA